MSGRWSNFPRSRAENDPGRDYETASSLGRGATVFTALFSFPYTVCNNRAPALSASSVERSRQIRGKLLTELVARNQPSILYVCVYVYIHIYKISIEEEEGGVARCSPSFDSKSIRSVNRNPTRWLYAFTIYIYIYTLVYPSSKNVSNYSLSFSLFLMHSRRFSYVARYKYKFISGRKKKRERGGTETGWVSIDGINRIDSERYKREEALQTCSRLVSLAPCFTRSSIRFLSRVINSYWTNLSIEREKERKRSNRGKGDKESWIRDFILWKRGPFRCPFVCPRGVPQLS